jgi:hypothetical protein
MRLIAWCFLLLLWSCSAVFAQQDSVIAGNTAKRSIHQGGNSLLDSVAAAMQARKLFVADSIAMRFIRVPDSSTTNEFTDSLLARTRYKGYGFLDIPLKTKDKVRDGLSRPQRDPWIIHYISLLLYTAALNITLNKRRKFCAGNRFTVSVYFTGRQRGRGGKPMGFFGPFFAFLFNFSLFCTSLAAYKGVYYVVSGSRLFVLLTIML